MYPSKVRLAGEFSDVVFGRRTIGWDDELSRSAGSVSFRHTRETAPRKRVWIRLAARSLTKQGPQFCEPCFQTDL